jgi:hypothetical protein
MAITKRDQVILNKFPESQIALQRIGDLPSKASLPLGDMIAEGTSHGSKQAVYSFAVNGGTIGAKVLASAVIPAYSTIDKVIVKVQSAVAPNTGLTATLNLVSGASTTQLQAFAAGGLSTVGNTQSLLAAPVDVGSQAASLSLSIAGAAATAGVVTFIVSYACPVQQAK